MSWNNIQTFFNLSFSLLSRAERPNQKYYFRPGQKELPVYECRAFHWSLSVSDTISDICWNTSGDYNIIILPPTFSAVVKLAQRWEQPLCSRALLKIEAFIINTDVFISRENYCSNLVHPPPPPPLMFSSICLRRINCLFVSFSLATKTGGQDCFSPNLFIWRAESSGVKSVRRSNSHY